MHESNLPLNAVADTNLQMCTSTYIRNLMCTTTEHLSNFRSLVFNFHLIFIHLMMCACPIFRFLKIYFIQLTLCNGRRSCVCVCMWETEEKIISYALTIMLSFFYASFSMIYEITSDIRMDEVFPTRNVKRN